MKKILVLLMVVSLGLFMVACGKKPEDPQPPDDAAPAANDAADDAADDVAAETNPEEELTDLPSLEEEDTSLDLPDVDVDLDFGDEKKE
jgi:hypothetical protein